MTDEELEAIANFDMDALVAQQEADIQQETAAADKLLEEENKKSEEALTALEEAEEEIVEEPVVDGGIVDSVDPKDEQALLSIQERFDSVYERLSKLESFVAENTELLPSVEDEVNFLKTQKFSPEDISKRYFKTKLNNTGFSTSVLFKYLGGTGNPTETLMAKYIHEQL